MRKTTQKTSQDFQRNLAGLSCYLLGWVTGIVFLIAARKNPFIRYHALQSIVTFGLITLVAIIFAAIPVIGWILTWILLVLAAVPWILLMVKAGQGQWYKLPLTGNIAGKQLRPAMIQD